MSLFKSNKEMYESEDHTNIIEFISQIKSLFFTFINKGRGGGGKYPPEINIFTTTPMSLDCLNYFC